jgi:hypothetical protein
MKGAWSSLLHVLLLFLFSFQSIFFRIVCFELPVRRRLCALALLCFAWPVSRESVSQSVSCRSASRRSAPPASPSAQARAMWRANRNGATSARTGVPAAASASAAAAAVASAAAPGRPQPPAHPLPSSASVSASQRSTCSSASRGGTTNTRQKHRCGRQLVHPRTDTAPQEVMKCVLVSSGALGRAPLAARTRHERRARYKRSSLVR